MGEVTTRGVDLLALRAGDPIAVQLPAGERRALEPV
jgi:hypothetical protein